ncbi:Protein PSK SIMULATOR 1 [Linum perenne]
MGGLCSRSSTLDNGGGSISHSNGHLNEQGGSIFDQSCDVKASTTATATTMKPPAIESVDDDGGNKQHEELGSSAELSVGSHGMSPDELYDGIPRLPRVLSNKSRSTKNKQAAVAKVSEVSYLLGRAGTAGLGKAVEVLDTLGSSMTNLNPSSGFTSGVTTKGDKIAILSFEVANTIVKGANLMQSLSKENIIHLKEVVLPSEGVQNLISKDREELLRIAAYDKREELKVFSGEVVRFGNRCKDPQWHNLDRYFDNVESQWMILDRNYCISSADSFVHCLVPDMQELYHEMHALDRFEQDYQRKLQEDENSSTAQRGDSLTILRAELKSQRKNVKSLKKKSLWSKILEEVMEKLVDIVHFLHLEIHEAFGNADCDRPVKSSANNHKKLGSAGLALHYANIITQIDTLVSRSSSVPPNTRDALYQGLPPSIKSALRPKLVFSQVDEERTVPQIKDEMEQTLRWLVPIAANTTKAHHGFGWVGEWANTGSEMNRKPAGQNDLLRIETLHHADQEKTEEHILHLVVLLHHLVNQARASNGGLLRSPVKSPIRSPNQTTIQLTTENPRSPILSVEDREMLKDVSKRKKPPGISKSQEFEIRRTGLSKHHRLSKSSSHSPIRETKRVDPFPLRRPLSIPLVIDFDIDRIKALDVMDRVDNIRSL